MIDTIRRLVEDGLEGGRPGSAVELALIPKHFVLGSKHCGLLAANEHGSFQDSCLERGKTALVLTDAIPEGRSYRALCARILEQFPADELEVQVKSEVLPEQFDRMHRFGKSAPAFLQPLLGYRVKRDGSTRQEWIGILVLHFSAAFSATNVPSDLLIGAAERADQG